MDKKLILIVEDDRDICCSLAKMLWAWGFDFLIACDGQDGLFKTKEKKPDLIILDLALPKLPGEELCRRIKNDEMTKDIPIIMQTGKCSDTDRVVGRVIGADCYFTKPYDPNELLEQIQKLTAKT